MPRRDLILAAAVLFVLAGLLTAAYAQNRTEDEPDAFELRRTLIHQIEESVTRDDLAALNRMKICADLDNEASDSDGLQRIEQAFGLPWFLNFLGIGGQLSLCNGLRDDMNEDCEAERNDCRRASSGAVEGQIFGSTNPDCANAFKLCGDEVFRVFNVCISQPPASG